jgi:hypothetical protein
VGEDADYWKAIAESLSISEQRMMDDAVEMSLNEQYMLTHALERLPALADGVLLMA